VLEDIRIRGLGVIEDVALELGPGLTVVTGETGAGKTMVVTALTLLFGSRADAARIRTGDTQASVEGTLSIPADGPVAARVRDAGGEIDLLPGEPAGRLGAGTTGAGGLGAGTTGAGGLGAGTTGAGGLGAGTTGAMATLTVRRVVAASGRSRASVGGVGAPVSLLGELAGSLFALHGQSDQLRLAQPAQQLAALDRYAGLDVAPLHMAFATWRAASEAHDQRIAQGRDMEREAQMLRHGLSEIEAVAPQAGEDSALDERIRRLSSADELRVSARDAQIALTGDPDDPSGDEQDARTMLARAQRTLTGEALDDPVLRGLAARLGDLVAAADDVSAELRDFAAGLAADPQGLAVSQERLSSLRGLTRRYGEDLPAVLEWARASALQLAQFDTSDEAIAALARARDEAERSLTALALDASARRREAAQTLGAAITAELRQLAMPAAHLEAQVDARSRVAGAPTVLIDGVPAAVGPDGLDQVALMLSAHPGAPAASLQRGASGGELSRVMLAVEVVLAGADPVPTMVFDEIDSGVGGRAATEIGRRLARLSRHRQVIVVTHLAQVAAYADTHVVIDKLVDEDEDADEDADADADADADSARSQAGEPDGFGNAGSDTVTRSDVRTVSGPARRAELARMLSGEDTATARRHAGELLERARAERAEMA
jgi:DNA repair protein RecN (Recombination protein N)